MPGAGGGVSQFLCHNEVKRTSKNPQEFGKGSLEGIAAAEASNNAIVGTALIPLLTRSWSYCSSFRGIYSSWNCSWTNYVYKTS